MSEVSRNRAELAREKKATFGADVDLQQYQILAEDQAEALDLDTLTTKDREKIIQSGIDLEEKGRAGTFLQADHRIVHCAATQPGLEVLPMAQALEEHSWLEKYYWQA
ncbi:MAG: SufD family Fe-S cluster assembly protein, partial [Deltaproteobacteria bacterium]|nr:SufD family Fe-S cluster assembly protein [Deltaproteobacteria bacterium]